MRWMPIATRSSTVACLTAAAALISPAMAHERDHDHDEVKTEVWQVIEGAQAQIQGQWLVTRSGGTITGTARMARLYASSITYDLNGEFQNGVYVIHRLNPSDGTDCVYRGSRNGAGKIAGTSFCGADTSMWNVQRPTRVRTHDGDHERDRH